MNLIEFLIRRPVLSIVITLIILMIGAVSYTNLSLRQFPEVDKPIISVKTALEGAGPKIVEMQVTRPLEEAFLGIEGLDYISSRSDAGNSSVNLFFKSDRDIDLAASDVRDRLQKVRNKLSTDADEPIITKAEADTDPIIYIALFSKRQSVEEMADYAHRSLEKELQTIPGVASVEVTGGGQLEMHLILDPVRLNAFKITASDILAALKKHNIQKPAGRLKTEAREFMVTLVSSLSTPAQFDNLIIAERKGQIIRLKDVGHAKLDSEDTVIATRFNDQPAVSIGIVKKSVANPLAIKKAVEEKVAQIRERLPEGTHIEISYDSTVFIEKSIHHVYRTLWEATLLVIAVVFLFLRSFRASMIPLVTIPVSLIGSFFLMFVFGFTINILTLLALVLAIGLVVDDAIVVLENVYRYIEEGMKPLQASIKGSKEISFAIIAMTLTLAAVYAPIALSSGMTGKVFTEFALTLAGSVIISGIVALTLTPMMCAKLLVAHTQQKPSSPSLPSSRWGAFLQTYHTACDAIGDWLDRLDQEYARFLAYLLGKRLLVIGSAVLFALIGVYLAQFQLQKELTPLEDQGVLRTRANAPYGATLKEQDKYALQIDKVLSSVPELVKRMTIVNTGDYTFSRNTMVPWEKRTRSCAAIRDLISPELYDIIGLDVTARCPNRSAIGSSSQWDLSFVIQTTRSSEDLAKQYQRVWTAMNQHPGIVPKSTTPDVGEEGQDYTLEVNRDKAASLGIDPGAISETLTHLVRGQVSTHFERDNKQYPIRVRVGDEFRRSPQDILALMVKGQRDNKETFVPLSDIAQIVPITTASEIHHFDGLRSVTLSASLVDGFGLGQVLNDITEAAERILPSGYQTTVSGETREFLQESHTLYIIFGLSLIFIFLVMAAQFESFIDPFIIILSVPLSLAGAIVALWISKHGTLNIYSQIGLVTLIGLITKHGILIVDFANKLQAQGLSAHDAVIQASRLRLRPILMTTFAMVFGAVPLAFSAGAGAETREQIGLVIVGGMSIGTLFTLCVIPIVYTYLSRQKVVEE